MKKIVLLSLALAGINTIQAQQLDTTKTQHLSEVVVNAIRAKKDAPFAVANIDKNELATFSKTGQELPFLFSHTPGVLAWGENGTGTGPVSMRLRGAAGSRINVTIDGVPLNSPEDESVFWVNMNSYAAILQSAQIQRGVGTSTNGDGAFGGSVSLNTLNPSYHPYFDLTGSYGFFNAYNIGANFSTGLLGKHFIFDGAYHETRTDGYIHGTDGRSGSYYGGLTYLGNNFILKYKNIGNFEKTGQAWNGVVAGNDDATLMDEGIRTYKDMYRAGLGKFNNLYEYLLFDSKDWTFQKDKNGNYMTQRYQLSDGSLWKRTTDNFYQNHNILSAAWQINPNWTTNASLRYTYGYGYYNEFRYQNKLAKFGISDFTKSDGTVLQKTDFIRKKGLTQNTYGFIWDTDYKSQYLDVTGGLALQYFTCNHWGRLTYMADPELAAKYMPNGSNYPYYDSDAHKGDYSGFIKATGKLTNWFDLFLDLQYRHIDYKTDGINDYFYDQKGKYNNQVLDINKHYNFFNPKAGINLHWDTQRAYASVAISHREPERNNFTDNGKYPAPKAEKVTDWEVGYEYTGSNWHAGVNLYDMAYHNQFVQTGELSDIGENLTTNIKKSYRVGAELTAGYAPFNFLTLEGNAALSKNRIKDFTEVVDNWDDEDNPVHVHYSKSTLSYSPSAILNGFLTAHFAGFEGTWHTNFVSRQYLDNTENKDRSLPCYSQTDISLNYTWKFQEIWKPIKKIILGLDLNNIFDRHYAPMGWVYSAVGKSSGYTLDKRYYQIGFNPMAGFNMMGHLTICF
ncbi:TonB-dependent receptor plug domain-containing protein [Prevotella cerevisiae]|uniref:TonB-dependent receptor plug domain-containing protein n=1 Tax=Segatella cerevisiae TaxID=2053716 RepID=A0ABT1BZQ5_9BACT|nr:TonB-dependent receptor [Segatella cerevisiae]MCO6025683.1 TonB-dependent receptor plug domain-containing protein [Segatella cerevisiae]